VAVDNLWRREVGATHPVFGGLAAATTPGPAVEQEPPAVAGEQRVAALLAACDGVVVLNDRRAGTSTASIDHIAIAPSGVYVIETNHDDGRVEARDLGSGSHSDVRLSLNGRDRTTLAMNVAQQVDMVGRLRWAGRPILENPALVRPVLCLVQAEWPLLLTHPMTVRGVAVVRPAQLRRLMMRPGPITGNAIDELAGRLDRALLST
jgi:hypothetical protein